MTTLGAALLADWASRQWIEAPDRKSARRALRHALGESFPHLEVLAEGFRAAHSEMDLLAVGDEGELTSARFTSSHEVEAMLTRSLSDLVWLRERAADLKKLAPTLNLEPTAAPRAILFSADFNEETRRASECLPTGTISLVRCRFFRQQGQLGALLDPLGAMSPIAGEPVPSPAPLTAEAADPLHSVPPAPPAPSTNPAASAAAPASEFTVRSGFRTGLSDADLLVEGS